MAIWVLLLFSFFGRVFVCLFVRGVFVLLLLGCFCCVVVGYFLLFVCVVFFNEEKPDKASGEIDPNTVQMSVSVVQGLLQSILFFFHVCRCFSEFLRDTCAWSIVCFPIQSLWWHGKCLYNRKRQTWWKNRHVCTMRSIKHLIILFAFRKFSEMSFVDKDRIAIWGWVSTQIFKFGWLII